MVHYRTAETATPFHPIASHSAGDSPAPAGTGFDQIASPNDTSPDPE